jgi:hypothetical protein
MNMTISKDEVIIKVREAVKAVEEADVPEDLRATAFEKAFEALIGVGQSAAGPISREPAAHLATAEGPSLAGIASRLGLDQALAEEVFYVDGDTLGLALAPSKFSPKKAAATQDIALLLAAGRQAGGWDEWTQVGHIRAACRDYGRFDAANFATTVRRMANVFSFRGKGRQLEVRVTRPGFEQAANLARELIGA